MRQSFAAFALALITWSCSPQKTATEETGVDSLTAQQITEPVNANDPLATLVVKWKSVDSSEWGPSFEFFDESGGTVTLYRLNIPGFSLTDNDYFTGLPVEGTPFAQYQIKDSAKDLWYEIKIDTITEENEQAGDGSTIDVPVIVAIKRH